MTLQALLQEPLSWPQEEWNERTREMKLLDRIVSDADIEGLKKRGISVKRCCLWRNTPVKISFFIQGKKRYSVDISGGDSVKVSVDYRDLNGTTPTTIEGLSALITSLAHQAG